jgi:hypothetical protein
MPSVTINHWILFGNGTAAAIAQALPYDLAEAIIVRAAQQEDILAGLTALYETRAGDRAVTPYAVYKIQNSSLLFTSDTIKIYDQRVSFAVIADTQDQANRMRGQVDTAYRTGGLSMTSSFAIPFFEVNRSEGEEPGRGANVTLRFRATIEYSARTSSPGTN